MYLNQTIRSHKFPIIFGVFLVFTIGFSSSYVFGQTENDYFFPEWIKLLAVWWGEDKITDSDFVNGLQYLILNEFLLIPKIENNSICGPGAILDDLTNGCVIPEKTDLEGIFPHTLSAQQSIILSWIKVTTLWWSQDKISDEEFVSALQYLVENNILILEPKTKPEPKIEQETQPKYPQLDPKIVKIKDFKIQGHGDTDTYYLQFKLVGPDNRAIGADGTISLVILDDRNRILYLDGFSVRKASFQSTYNTFGDKGESAFLWEVPTSKLKTGFSSFGTSQLVFTDLYGNSFLSEYNKISIPHYK